NDTAAAGVSAAAQLVTAPVHGSLTFNIDGSFTYVPASTFYGSDSFTYQTRDSSTQNNLSNVATVAIVVRHINTAPVAQNDGYVAPRCTGTPLMTIPAPGVLAND